MLVYTGSNFNSLLVQVDESDKTNPKIWLTVKANVAYSDGVPGKSGDSVSSTRSGTAVSDPYSSVLEQNRLGPFPNLRDSFYGALERNATSNLDVGALLTRCIAEVKGEHPAAKVSWTTVRNFFSALLSKHPVLKGTSGQVIIPSLATLFDSVTGINEGWKEDLEGSLIVMLLELGCSIEFTDLPKLTGSLYLTREEANQDRLHNVIKRLLAQGRVALSDGHLKITA